MRNRSYTSILLIAVLWLLAVGVFLFGVISNAQTQTNPGWSGGGRPTRVTVTGIVNDVVRHACSPVFLASQKKNTRSPNCAITEVVLTTKEGLVNVRIGPTKFIRDNDFFFVDGDRLLIVGLLIPGRDRSTVVPEEVIKSKRDLILRDPNGRPLWERHELPRNTSNGQISDTADQSSSKPRTRSLDRWEKKEVAPDLRMSELEKEK